MRVLAIGNSFTENASRFIREIIADGGLELTYRKATIGGKSVENHWRNLESGEPLYSGRPLGEIIDEGWDAVILQNQSYMAAIAEKWQPWTEKIVARIRVKSPGARIIFYQTWAYHAENPRLVNDLGGMTQAQMLDAIKANCTALADAYDGGIIPVGEAFRLTQEMTGDATGEIARKNDGSSHANRLGEYIAGLMFWSYFTGGDVDKINFVPDEVDPETVPLAKKVAKLALETAR